MKAARASLVLALVSATSACLPSETRTRPGTLTLSVMAPFDASESFETEDGWTVSLDHVYANVGRVELAGDDCDAYSEAGYSRLLDLSGRPQRLSLLYGLGRCSFSFAVGPPRWNTVLGDAVPAEVEARFRTPGSDGETDGGVSLYVAGGARRADQVVSFAWPLRARLALEDCRLGEPAAPLVLTPGAEQAVELWLDARELLRDQAGALLFDPFAAADGAGAPPDGQLGLEELTGAPGAAPSKTLFHELYYARLPRLAGVSGGTCTGRLESCSDGGCDD
jgi:hypothetical protein